MTSDSWDQQEQAAEQPPCPRCEAAEGAPGTAPWEGTPCPTCGRVLPLPAGLPGGTVLTALLSMKLLGSNIHQTWNIARSVLDDEGLRTNLFVPIDAETPDAYISLNHAEVPDPVSASVEDLVEKEQRGQSVGVRRLLFALRKRKALLATILRETYGAGFQRDEARVAARLGFRLNTVRLAVRDKTLIRV